MLYRSILMFLFFFLYHNRQLKEKTKQLVSLKKNQTSEKEKQHQLVNESKKVEQEFQQLEVTDNSLGLVCVLYFSLYQSMELKQQRQKSFVVLLEK